MCSHPWHRVVAYAIYRQLVVHPSDCWVLLPLCEIHVAVMLIARCEGVSEDRVSGEARHEFHEFYSLFCLHIGVSRREFLHETHQPAHILLVGGGVYEVVADEVSVAFNRHGVYVGRVFPCLVHQSAVAAVRHLCVLSAVHEHDRAAVGALECCDGTCLLCVDAKGFPHDIPDDGVEVFFRHSGQEHPAVMPHEILHARECGERDQCVDVAVLCERPDRHCSAHRHSHDDDWHVFVYSLCLDIVCHRLHVLCLLVCETDAVAVALPVSAEVGHDCSDTLLVEFCRVSVVSRYRRVLYSRQTYYHAFRLVGTYLVCENPHSVSRREAEGIRCGQSEVARVVDLIVVHVFTDEPFHHLFRLSLHLSQDDCEAVGGLYTSGGCAVNCRRRP